MKEFSELDKIRRQVGKCNTVFYWIVAVCIILTVILAVAEASLREVIKSSSTSQQTIAPNTWLYVLYAVHVPVGVIAAIGTLLFKQINTENLACDLHKFDEKFHELERKNRLSNDNLRAFASQEYAVLAGLLALETIAGNPKRFLDEKDALHVIVNPLVKLRKPALGFGDDGYHNFVVYKYDKKHDELSPIYREYDDRIERHDRKWKLAEGHVGYAFMKEDPVITQDIKKSDLKIPSKKQFTTDAEFYQSFITAPIIGNAKKIKDRIGVFAITSSKKDQFTESHKILANCYTILISMYYNVVERHSKEYKDGSTSSSTVGKSKY